MCGIVGYATTGPMQNGGEWLGAACDAMRHRGPDARGVWHDEHCGLGHRRLSIIDLAGGAQPMSYADGRYWIVFNGEIYNYRDLRSTLSHLGHRFRTSSDTEVILAAYAEWGLETPSRLRGIFAFALWDRHARSLLLARDHLGVKPLVYAVQPHALVFSSELKGILAATSSRTLEPTAISDYLALGYVMGTKTIVRGIERLAPGALLVWQDGRTTVRRYWDLAAAARASGSAELSDDEYTRGYLERLDDAVTAQMVSDVPVGAFLSGGLDSSSIALLMRQKTHRLQTFSMGFVEPSFSELEYAAQVATVLETEHHTQVISEDLATSLPGLVRVFDEPLGDTSIVPTYLVSRLASRHVKVVLSGDGADETLAGYDTYAADALQRWYRRVPDGAHDHVIRPLAQLIPDSRRKVSLNYKVKQFVAHAHEDWRRAHYGWRLLFPDHLRDALLGGATPGHDPFMEYRSYFDEVINADELNQALYVDIKTWLANDILVKVDRASMSVGLEARVPFLDPQLVEYSMRLPARLKMSGLTRKVVLRRAMRGRLPKAVLRRQKRGFNAPVSDWMRGTLRPIVEDLFSAASTVVDVRRPELQRLWRDHLSGRADYGFPLWALVSLLLWERGVLHAADTLPAAAAARP